uniref:Uncharacterized protein LOC111136069 n=1 Tax=Crassostrea virginica TaxID=6565 RepID=A0A8B8EQZ3_CRAVI|nr:uncharacterized protein LOC111136069 [Crassostrea virginica]
MMNRGNSSQYISCDEQIEDGCQPVVNTSRQVITLSFTDRGSGYCKIESIKADPRECSLTASIRECKYYIMGFGSGCDHARSLYLFLCKVSGNKTAIDKRKGYMSRTSS